MKNITYLILAVILSFSISCGDSGGRDEFINGVAISHKVLQKTDKQAEVYSENGVSAAQLSQIDAGLDQAIADARLSGWQDNGKAYNHGLYQILIPKEPCRPSPESQTPSFLVFATNYDGSVYDQHNTKGELPVAQQNDWDKYVKDGVGKILASEMVTGFNTPGSTTNGQQNAYASFIVCPEASVLKNGTQYGAEHSIVAHYDSDYFNETMTHSTISHPILPKRSSVKGLVTPKSNPAAFTEYIPDPVK